MPCLWQYAATSSAGIEMGRSSGTLERVYGPVGWIDGKPGSLTGGTVLNREGHRAAAREALARARALMAPAADGTPSPWANDQDAKVLLAEAAALIEGQPGGPATTPEAK